MAAVRAFLIVWLIALSVLVAVPLQRLVARLAPHRRDVLPNAFHRLLLRLMRVRLRVVGTPAREGAVLIAANHVSWIDISAFCAAQPVCFLAKSEVASWPVFSRFADVNGTVYVERGRADSIPEANRAMAERMAAGRAMVLFPEATTVDGPVGAFRSSHFGAIREVRRARPDLPCLVQPVAVAYSSPRAAWVGDDTLLGHLWRTLRAPPLTCRLSYGTPLACGPDMNRKAVAEAARAAIVAMNESRVAAGAARAEAEHELAGAATTRC